MRMVEALSPCLLADMFATARCSYGDATVAGAARVAFHGDGRPKQIVLADGLLKPACARVLRFISDTGCVKGARIVRSVHPTIDLAAMNAVAQWRFSPTRLDGQAVPVIMTVTVNCTLQ